MPDTRTSAPFQNLDETIQRSVVFPPDAGYTFPEGAAVILHEFMGRFGSAMHGPQALLARFPVDSSVAAHFHEVNQFQVFFGSVGAFYQRHPIEDRVTVHYSDAYTTYGPFGTGHCDMDFLTLRPQPSTFTGYMPGARDQIRRHGGKNLFGTLSMRTPSDRLADGQTRLSTLFDEPGSGAAVLVELGPSCRFGIRSSREHGGEFCIVTDGHLRLGNKTYERLALAWVGADEEFVVETDGDSCAELLRLRFPRDVADGSEPAYELDASSSIE